MVRGILGKSKLICRELSERVIICHLLKRGTYEMSSIEIVAGVRRGSQ